MKFITSPDTLKEFVATQFADIDSPGDLQEEIAEAITMIKHRTHGIHDDCLAEGEAAVNTAIALVIIYFGVCDHKPHADETVKRLAYASADLAVAFMWSWMASHGFEIGEDDEEDQPMPMHSSAVH